MLVHVADVTRCSSLSAAVQRSSDEVGDNLLLLLLLTPFTYTYLLFVMRNDLGISVTSPAISPDNITQQMDYKP